MMRVGFVGFGRMGGSLARGAISSGALKKNQIVAFNPSKNKEIRKAGAEVASSIADIVSSCVIIFLCVKPQKMGAVLAEVQDALRSHHRKNICFVSIAAGTTMARIQRFLGKKIALARVMPNTPALLGAGMSALSFGPNLSRGQKNVIASVLRGVGDLVVVPEKFMDGITALSGSGPAYVFYLAEGMIRAARKIGLSEDLARLLVHQTIFGAGTMLKQKKESADELRHQVTSPGGTTAAAIAEFEKRRFLKIVESAVNKATARSKELGK